MSYEKIVKDNLEGLHAFSFGPSHLCSDCLSHYFVEDNEIEEFKLDIEKGFYAGEIAFGTGSCDACSDHHAGARHIAHSLTDTNEIVHLEVCARCVMFLTYGEDPEANKSEEENAEYD